MNNQTPTKVKDVMKTEFLTMEGLDTVQQAIDRMLPDRLRLVLIKPRNDHDEYGIVVLKDIAKKIIAHDRAPDRVNLFEIMSKPVISVDADMDIRYCARLFHQFGLSVAPVMHKRKLIGTVTYGDIVFSGLQKSI